MDFRKYLTEFLTEKAKNYAAQNKMITHKHKTAIIFEEIKDNFFPTSFTNILKNSEYKERLEKPHSKTNLKNARELQSSNSSDALLMNIFCHPKISEWKGIRDLLSENSENIKNLKFGYDPNFKNEKNQTHKTEIDLKIGDTLFEAKLTEKDFTEQSTEIVEKYDDFNNIFDKDLLLKDNGIVQGYQIIRNILAVFQDNKRHRKHRLICDLRRGDLVQEYYQVINAIKIKKEKDRFKVIFWQEIARVCG